MKRKEISRVKAKAEITAENIVWEGYKVTGPIDQTLKCLLPMIQVSTGGDHTAKHRKRTNARWVLFNRNRQESFDEIAIVVERDLPSDIRWEGVSCLDRTLAHGSRGWNGWQRKLVSLQFHFWRFFSIIVGGRRRCSCGSTPWAKVEASAIFYHGYTERRFALRLFSVNSHNSRYPENSGFFNSIIIERACSFSYPGRSFFFCMKVASQCSSLFASILPVKNVLCLVLSIGVHVGVCGDFSLRMRPMLTFTPEHAKFVLATFDSVLSKL